MHEDDQTNATFSPHANQFHQPNVIGNEDSHYNPNEVEDKDDGSIDRM